MKLTGGHEKILAQMRQIALKHPEKIRIVETNVNAEVQLEFYSMMQDVDKSYHDMALPEIFRQLSDCDDMQHRKKLLVAIASTGEIEAYRFLEKYLETCNDLNEIRTQRESIIDAEIKLSEKIVNIPAITEEDKKTLVWNLQMYIEAVKELFDNAIFMLEN